MHSMEPLTSCWDNTNVPIKSKSIATKAHRNWYARIAVFQFILIHSKTYHTKPNRFPDPSKKIKIHFLLFKFSENLGNQNVEQGSTNT